MLKKAELGRDLNISLFLTFWLLGLSYKLPVGPLLWGLIFLDILTVEIFHCIVRVKLCLRILKHFMPFRDRATNGHYLLLYYSHNALHFWQNTLHTGKCQNVYRRKKQTKAQFVFTQVILINELCKKPQSNSFLIFLIFLYARRQNFWCSYHNYIFSSVNLECLGCCWQEFYLY